MNTIVAKGVEMEATKNILQKARRRLPPWEEVAAEAKERAEKIEIGQTLFFKEHGVASEAEYKRRAKRQGKIMTHAHIGLDSWEETKTALLYLQDEMSKRELAIDRFGLCLDRVMAYPPEMRDSVPRETGPQLRSLEDWMEVGQVVPIQPHAGDFMIGFPASMINTECALRAGITTIGNLSQYFAHDVPAWDDEVKTAVETAKAISVMGQLRDQGTLIHSYLDDGFGALFNDYANVAGWAYLEKYIVEDLFGAKLAHCFGGVTADPLTRVAWVMIMREIHGDDCVGSMWYGDTISFSEDFDRNLGLDAEYLLWDMVAQLVCPTGHAVHPLPVTEAVRIPTAREIAQVHVFARRVEEAARRLAPHLDLTQAEAMKDKLILAGRKVFERALAGLQAQGVDVQNPLEMIFVLKKIGPEEFEREYGAGAPDPSWPQGRKPVQLTDIFARTYTMSEAIVQDLPQATRKDTVRVVLCSTDVHAHALFVIQRALDAMGFSPWVAGSEMNPAEIVEVARDQAAGALVVGTYNGMALEVGKALRAELDRVGLRMPVFMGGKLNQAVEGKALPVDVSKELAALGIVPCQTIPELLRVLDDMIL
jgi:methylmalonyl-CoA mutase cobalamin-binding subunit